MYPENLINSTITRFTESRNQQQVRDVQASAPIQIILPFKDQRSADVVQRQLSNLGKKINSDLRPVFTSKKITNDIKIAEAKPPLINQQCVVYKFKCDLCYADYVGYIRRHQCIAEHKPSAIGKHLRDAHNQNNKDLDEQFTILKKFEFLVYEMLFIQEMKPKLNMQSDSIKAKLFNRAAMGRARFLIHPWFIFLLLSCRLAEPNFSQPVFKWRNLCQWWDADLHSAKSCSGLWITQPVMFICQKLLKH